MILHKVVLATSSKKGLERIRSVLGERAYASLTEKTIKKVNALAELGLKSYQSKVPIDTGALRNQNLHLTQATRANPIATISVDGSHTGRRGHTTQSSILADYLNIGTSPGGTSLRRSRESEATSPYTSIGAKQPTKGWIKSARLAFAAARRKRGV